MKWENSEPDSPKAVNSCKTSFITVLNTLCKPFPMLRIAFNAPFHSNFLCLTRSHILQRAYLLLTVGWVLLLSQMSCNISLDIISWSDSSLDSRFSIYCLLIISDLLSDLSPLSASLQFSVNIFSSSNCANVITSPVCSFEDVAYGGIRHCRTHRHRFWIRSWRIW